MKKIEWMIWMMLESRRPIHTIFNEYHDYMKSLRNSVIGVLFLGGRDTTMKYGS